MPEESAPKPPLGERLKAMFAEYGPLALTIYLVIFALTFAGAATLIAMGVEIEGATAGAGLIGAAWLATKITQPIRILATLALTPIVGKLRRRKKGVR